MERDCKNRLIFLIIKIINIKIALFVPFACHTLPLAWRLTIIPAYLYFHISLPNWQEYIYYTYLTI